MPDDSAFLRAVQDHPDDDAPRLVYADWLEERGDADRAELIRIQCWHARRYPGTAGEWWGNHDLELPAQRGHAWAARPDWLAEWRWRRGFAESVACSLTDFRRHGRGLLAANPLRQVVLRDVRVAFTVTGRPAGWEVVAANSPRLTETLRFASRDELSAGLAGWAADLVADWVGRQVLEVGEVEVADLPAGLEAFVVPWAVEYDRRYKLWVRGDYTCGPGPHGRRRVRVRREPDHVVLLDTSLPEVLRGAGNPADDDYIQHAVRRWRALPAVIG